jgi:hypothetical protein
MPGELCHINKLQYRPLETVLDDKYLFPKPTTDTITSFLTLMLHLHPDTAEMWTGPPLPPTDITPVTHHLCSLLCNFHSPLWQRRMQGRGQGVKNTLDMDGAQFAY